MLDVKPDALLVITRQFQVPVARVFNAWLSPAQWQAWLGPDGVRCEVMQLEPRVGGRFQLCLRTPDGQMPRVAGVYQSIEPGRQLVFTWGWDDDPHRQSLVSLRFDAAGDGCALSLRQEGLGTAADRDDHERGWSGSFDRLARLLAR